MANSIFIWSPFAEIKVHRLLNELPETICYHLAAVGTPADFVNFLIDVQDAYNLVVGKNNPAILESTAISNPFRNFQKPSNRRNAYNKFDWYIFNELDSKQKLANDFWRTETYRYLLAYLPVAHLREFCTIKTPKGVGISWNLFTDVKTWQAGLVIYGPKRDSIQHEYAVMPLNDLKREFETEDVLFALAGL